MQGRRLARLANEQEDSHVEAEGCSRIGQEDEGVNPDHRGRHDLLQLQRHEGDTEECERGGCNVVHLQLGRIECHFSWVEGQITQGQPCAHVNLQYYDNWLRSKLLKSCFTGR